MENNKRKIGQVKCIYGRVYMIAWSLMFSKGCFGSVDG